MKLKQKIAIILLLISATIIGFVDYMALTTSSEENIMKGDHNVLMLCVDPSEKRPGMGAIDMGFIVHTHDGKVVNTTPIYPGGMTHPTASPPQYLKESQGVNVLYLHDALWDEDVEKGAKLAQEIVEYNTGQKTDAVVIFTPEAVDALIQSIAPIYINGQEYANGSSIEFLRNEQYGGMSRGNAVEGMMKAIMDKSSDPANYSKILQTGATEYTKGNIVVIPKDLFIKLLISNGLGTLI